MGGQKSNACGLLVPESVPVCCLGAKIKSSNSCQVPANSRHNSAEGTGLEPATPCGAPEFQSGR